MTILRNKLIWIAVAIAFLGGYYYSLVNKKDRAVESIKVVKKKFQKTVVMNGNLEPIRKAIIVAPFNGFIRKIHVKVGQLVKAGDPVVTLTQTMSADEPIHPIRSGISGRLMAIMHMEGEFVKGGRSAELLIILRIDDLKVNTTSTPMLPNSA